MDSQSKSNATALTIITSGIIGGLFLYLSSNEKQYGTIIYKIRKCWLFRFKKLCSLLWNFWCHYSNIYFVYFIIYF